MKDPKALFPFLFASSWLGNLLLTILAFFLAFTHDGPLTPLLFLTVALCILAGNILPIGSYYLFIKWRQSELNAEAAQASLGVRDALRRSEEVIARLDEAEGALSKAILIGRQLPERIGERFKAVEDLTTKLNTLEISSFSETLREGNNSVSVLGEKSGEIHEAIQRLEKIIASLPETLSSTVTDALPKAGSAGAGEADVSLGERLDLVYESLESVQDSLDGLLERMASLASAATRESPPPVEEVGEPEETLAGEEDPGEWDELEEADPEEEPEAPEPEAPQAAQEELLMAHSAEEVEPARVIAPDRARLSVQAMVGISNKLYIRGDEPWLSWDEGRPMDLVGIGEFAFEVGDLKETIEVSVLLNDDIESDAGRIILKPGKVLRIHPNFPR